MNPRNALIPAALALSLLMAGCTSGSAGAPEETPSTQPAASSPAASASGTVADDGTYSGAGITVTGAPGEKPTITLADEFGPASELLVVDIVAGDGDAVAQGSVLTVHYVGVGQQSREVFDSSWEREPATFDLAGVIAGWQQGMLGMQPGGRRLLVIPGSLAYGPGGAGGVIGPDETLVFVVDLLEQSAS